MSSNKDSDNQSYSSSATGRGKSRKGKGTFHCLNIECYGRNPILKKNKNQHKHQDKFEECTFGQQGNEECKHCNVRKSDDKSSKSHLTKPCPYCNTLIRGSNHSRHVQSCVKNQEKKDTDIKSQNDSKLKARRNDKESLKSGKKLEQPYFQEDLHKENQLPNFEVCSAQDRNGEQLYEQQQKLESFSTISKFKSQRDLQLNLELINNPSESLSESDGQLPDTLNDINDDLIEKQYANKEIKAAKRFAVDILKQTEQAKLMKNNQLQQLYEAIYQLNCKIYQKLKNKNEEKILQESQKLDSAVKEVEALNQQTPWIIGNAHNKLMQLQHSKLFEDTDDYDKRLSEILSLEQPTETDLNNLCATRNYVKEAMSAWEFEPNNSQMAVAMASVYLLMKGKAKKQIWTYPAGYGKSRIEVAIILGVFKQGHKGKKVVTVFHHETVKQQDEEVFLKLGQILDGEQISLNSTVGLKDAIKLCDQKTLLIIDECDRHLLDGEQQDITDFKALKPYGVVGLSASLPRHLQQDLFKLKQQQGFQLQKSCVEPKLFVQNDITVTIAQFLKRIDRAKLIFANKDQLETIRKQNEMLSINERHRISENETNPTKLRQLTKENLLIVTETNEDLMRGCDYRCKTGIDLLIATPLSHERAYLQAIGRVGRYTDQGSRFKITGMSECWKSSRNDN